MNDRTDQDKQGQTAVGPTSSIADAKRSAVNRRNMLLGGTTLAAAAIGASAPLTIAQAQAPQQPAPSAGKPNILVIFGDDIGITNISAYSDGLMGYETPNIDRIGQRGHSASCTTTASSPAPPAARRSSPASTASAPG